LPVAPPPPALEPAITTLRMPGKVATTLGRISAMLRRPTNHWLLGPSGTLLRLLPRWKSPVQ